MFPQKLNLRYVHKVVGNNYIILYEKFVETPCNQIDFIDIFNKINLITWCFHNLLYNII